MSGFNISLFGLGNGLKKGLQYDVDFLVEIRWAVTHNKTDALKELTDIATMNIKELTDEVGNIKENVITAILFGSDPTAGSRHAFQEWRKKWGTHK